MNLPGNVWMKSVLAAAVVAGLALAPAWGQGNGQGGYDGYVKQKTVKHAARKHAVKSVRVAGGGSNTGFDGYKRVADGGTYGGNGHGGYDGYVKPKPVKHAARKTRVADGGAGIDGYMRVAGGTSGGNGFGGYDGYSKRRYSGQNMRVAGGGNGSVGGEGGIDGYKKKPVKQRVAHKAKSKPVKDGYAVRTVQ
jgi:hypothetical protein